MVRKRVIILAGALIFVLVVLAAVATVTASAPDPADPALAGSPSGNGVLPVPYEGNTSCTDFGYDFGFKIEPPISGTYPFPDGFNGIQVTVSGVNFDWLATLGIDAVIVKGGGYSNLYTYNPEVGGDTALHAPINTNNSQYYGLSHLEFCFDYELAVNKTATTAFTRTWEWAIEKSVDPAELHLFAGGSGDAGYTVTADRVGFTDSDFQVAGAITVENNTPYSAIISSVADTISDYSGTVTVSCGVSFPYTLPAGQVLNCTYLSALEATEVFGNTNSAIVETMGTVGGGSDTAGVIFGDPTTLVNEKVTVTDEFDGGDPGELGTISDDSIFRYDRPFTCSNDPDDYTDGYYQYEKDDLAKIVETGQSDDAAVTVHCYAPVPSKDARASFTRTWNWDIAKSVVPAELWLFAGQSQGVLYTVQVTKTGYNDSGWGVEGTITVKNPHPTQAMQLTLADFVSPDIPATLTCGSSLSVPAEGTATCDYSASLPDGTNRTNTVTVTLNEVDFSASADVVFGDPLTVVNDTVTITDTYFGSFGKVSGNETFTYPRTFGCSSNPGDYTAGTYAHTEGNTATIVETADPADASVKVNCYAPVVTKDAETSFTRTWTWEIEKSAAPERVTLSPGQSHPVEYSVSLAAASTDSQWAVEGTITVENPNPKAAMTVAIADIISPDIVATLDCGGSLNVPANGSATCAYHASLPDGSNRTNTATATLNTVDFSYSTGVDFGKARIGEIDECVNVTDDLYGTLGPLCAGESPKTFSYTQNAGPYMACGAYQVTNTATFVANDTDATGQASRTVAIDVPCVGCTLTQGYWKTHSNYGPAPYDDNWANIGPDTTFFLSGRSYHQVLLTPPKGDPYWILAHAYIAAKLNVLNGAAAPAGANAAIAWAEAFFNSNAPGAKLSKSLRADVIANAGVLDSFNNGVIGPGHCTE
jgi:hypothetical protein